MKNIIIGFGSKAQIGKDYACEGLKKHFNVKRIAFADNLKNDLKILFKLNNLDFDSVMAEPKLKEKVRPLLVAYGQIMREFNPNIWVSRALDNIQLTHQVTVITDVRFPNEVEALKAMGGYYIEIESNVPPANETEALYSPLMAGLADFKVKNNFDGSFIPTVVDLVSKLTEGQNEDTKN